MRASGHSTFLEESASKGKEVIRVRIGQHRKEKKSFKSGTEMSFR